MCAASVAIVGAGIAGLACAKELQKIENVKISILSMAYTEWN